MASPCGDPDRPVTLPPSSTPPNTPSVPSRPLASTASTPTTQRYGSGPEERASVRATSLLDTLREMNKLWFEKPCLETSRSGMIDRFLAGMDERYHVFAEEMIDLPEINNFLRTSGRGLVNEDEFSGVINAISSRFASTYASPLRDSEIRYVRSGDQVVHPRVHGHPWLKEQLQPADGRFGLKPDFFTARVRRDKETGEVWPLSLSTVLHQDPCSTPSSASTMVSATTATAAESTQRRSTRIAMRSANTRFPTTASSPQPPPITNPLVIPNVNALFTWDDIHLLWELKSSPNTVNTPHVLSNLLLKATEALRFQWSRRFLLGFVVCGTELRMVRVQREGVLVGRAVDVRDAVGVLVKCILAGLAMRSEELGLFPSGDSQDPRTVLIEGKPRLIISVANQDFILGDQIVGNQRDHLVSRATTVHLARRPGDNAWRYCFKTAWPYAARPHEGLVLEDLQNVPGVVRVLAWDAPIVEGSLSEEEICRDFWLHTVSVRASVTASAASSSEQRRSTAGTGPDDENANTSDGLQPFHLRQCRQTVTEHIPESFAALTPHDPLDILYAWRSLYLVVDAIATKGWVHRDLSWNNVRLFRHPDNPDSPLSATLIDFDLAAPIIGPSTGSPDKTGTAIFMPIDILKSTSDCPVRHQELHEDEAVFWVGFLAFVSRSVAGRNYIHAHLQKSRISLDELARTKYDMFSPGTQKRDWPAWFNHPQPGNQQSNTLLRGLCSRIAGIQFTNDEGVPGDTAYPDVGEVEERTGRRRHEVLHERVHGEILRELDKGIEELIELRRGVRGDVVGDGAVEKGLTSSPSV